MPKWLLTSLRLATTTSYDAARRMTQAEPAAGIVTFTYNADHQRVAKQSTDGSTTGYLYDYKRLLEETDGQGGSVDVTYTTTTDDEYGSLIGEDGDGGQLYHQYDAQWSTNVLQDDTGDIEGQYKYTAFGLPEPAPAIAPPSNFMAFGQKQYYTDVETNLYLLGGGGSSIYYDPATGRRISQDPIRWASGDTNFYPPVQNDPVNKVDPSGQTEYVEYHGPVVVIDDRRYILVPGEEGMPDRAFEYLLRVVKTPKDIDEIVDYEAQAGNQLDIDYVKALRAKLSDKSETIKLSYPSITAAPQDITDRVKRRIAILNSDQWYFGTKTEDQLTQAGLSRLEIHEALDGVDLAPGEADQLRLFLNVDPVSGGIKKEPFPFHYGNIRVNLTRVSTPDGQVAYYLEQG